MPGGLTDQSIGKTDRAGHWGRALRIRRLVCGLPRRATDALGQRPLPEPRFTCRPSLAVARAAPPPGKPNALAPEEAPEAGAPECPADDLVLHAPSDPLRVTGRYGLNIPQMAGRPIKGAAEAQCFSQATPS